MQTQDTLIKTDYMKLLIWLTTEVFYGGVFLCDGWSSTSHCANEQLCIVSRNGQTVVFSPAVMKPGQLLGHVDRMWMHEVFEAPLSRVL